nr:hypothetical protein [Siccirubricoccus sp. G192]
MGEDRREEGGPAGHQAGFDRPAPVIKGGEIGRLAAEGPGIRAPRLRPKDRLGPDEAAEGVGQPGVDRRDPREAHPPLGRRLRCREQAAGQPGDVVRQASGGHSLAAQALVERAPRRNDGERDRDECMHMVQPAVALDGTGRDQARGRLHLAHLAQDPLLERRAFLLRQVLQHGGDEGDGIAGEAPDPFIEVLARRVRGPEPGHQRDHHNADQRAFHARQGDRPGSPGHQHRGEHDDRRRHAAHQGPIAMHAAQDMDETRIGRHPGTQHGEFEIGIARDLKDAEAGAGAQRRPDDAEEATFEQQAP